MDTIECIKTRMSIRKFRPDPVPKDILLDIINTAQLSPSYKNSQPWEAVIVSGRKKEGLSDLLLGLIEKGTKPEPDLTAPASWPIEIETRIKEHQRKRSEKIGINPGDPDLIKKSMTANFRFYGAPHAIFLFQDAALSAWSIFDMGLFAQSLMLAAHAHGIGTVPQAFLVNYSKEVRNFLEIPESKRLILGISAGYPDLGDKANSYRSARIDCKSIIRWLE